MLTKITSETFFQLRHIIEQLSNDQYTQKLEILNNSSIGEHVRHVLEFYVCLREGIETGTVDYDRRKRNLNLENDINFVIALLDELCENFCMKDHDDSSLVNHIEYQNFEIRAKSSLTRELVYLIEHSIHHYAIIGIAVRNVFKDVDIPKDFGVAYSTTKHHKKHEEKDVA